MSSVPFHIRVDEEELDDLKRRIRETYWPGEIIGSGWKFGANLTYMKELAEYWQSKFDWRKVEDEINSCPNFTANIDGHEIHFMHIKGIGDQCLPLIITHGWPGSFLEFKKIIPLLTAGEDLCFDLVIPSMIGYGFSEKPKAEGSHLFLMADLWVKLMKELGYEKFFAQGGDFGAGITTVMALKYPQHLIGIHLNYIPGSYRPYLDSQENLSGEELQFEKDAGEWSAREGAYSHQHKTKPQTLSYALNDSPVGLAAWLVEKYYGWADCKGNIESCFTKDELLANITLYWLTHTIHSAIRLYYENSRVPLHFLKDEFIWVPVGVARFPLEEPFPPRSLIERGYNVQHWTDMAVGGHFAAMEQPALLADDIRAFAKKITSAKSSQ